MNDRDKIALKLYDLGTDRREDWWLRYADALLAPGGPVAEIVAERMSAARVGGVEYGQNVMRRRLAPLAARWDSYAGHGEAAAWPYAAAELRYALSEDDDAESA